MVNSCLAYLSDEDILAFVDKAFPELGAHVNTGFTLSQGVLHMVDIALGHAWADSTLDKYKNSLSHFHAFCDKENVPMAARLPASEFLLCAFAASNTGVLAGSTVSGKLAAVRAWHIINNTNYLGSVRLCYVVKGVENMSPSSSSRPPRPPITADMLRILHNNLDMTAPFDVAVYTAAVVAFWRQCCLGEVLSPTERSFDPRRIPSITDLKPPCTSAGSRILHLPYTKTAGDNAGKQIPLQRLVIKSW